ncbi:MAG: transglutaminase-like cysteine peptidase [Methylococcaceae bacterium]
MPVVKYRLLIGFIIVVIAGLGVIRGFFSEPDKNENWLPLPPVMLDKIERKYGLAARQRFIDWQQLMVTGKTLPERDKLQQVNDFFNRHITFSSDLVVWLKNDYWATPVELLAKGAGDCEDFSIAKYFTLIETGVDESKLRITYVKALQLNLPHMVLTYFESPQAVPLVLDNLMPNISSATERSDLLPVYSFNGSSLWLTKIKENSQPVGNVDRLNMWTDLKQRMLEKVF